MPKRKRIRSQLYQRAGRWWGDLRAYKDVGGAQQPLIAPGERLATTDKVVAQTLLTSRLKVLEAKRQNRTLHGVAKQTDLGTFAPVHLIAKAESGKWTYQWLAAVEVNLGRAVSYFGADRDLASITVQDVRAFAAHLGQLPNGRGGKMGPGNIRHHLNALSNLFGRAAAEGYVQPGYNPVAAWDEKPAGDPGEAAALQPHEVALFLEAARTFVPRVEEDALHFGYPLVATYALTGGRRREVFGLEQDDISFERKTVTFHPNSWRRLKTRGSSRVVPLWPQLEEILREYLKGPHRPTGNLLFPSPVGSGEAMVVDDRKLLDNVSVRAGFLERRVINKKGKVKLIGRFIRSRVFRHSYCAARLQTLDRGQPVALYTVSRELGHRGTTMVENVYAHLGDVRHRAEVVEFRVSQHLDRRLPDGSVVADRVAAMAGGDNAEPPPK